jgi:hypothetical protein
MRNLISGDTADECLVQTLRSINRHGCTDPGIETFHKLPYPAAICLTNPLARFSLSSIWDPRAGIILGLCAFAGINADALITNFNLTFKPFLPGPYFRGFNSEVKPYLVDLKNAGTRLGNVDQLAEAVDFLRKNPEGSFISSLRDPKKKTDQGSGIAVSTRFFADTAGRLAASVYVPELDAVKHLVSYIIPTYTFIQQVLALLLDKRLGQFYILYDEVHYNECETSRAILAKSPSRIKGLRNFCYQESKAFDLRYLDMIIQHLIGFIRRIRDGDLLVENPFKNLGHLEVFRDYGEAFRYAEAVDRKISWGGEHEIKHPQLAHYYGFQSF